MAEFEVKGLRELQAAMNTLKADMAGKIAVQATAAAAGVVRKAARMKAPKDSGNLQAAIIMKRRKKTSLSALYAVGVRSGGGFRKGDFVGGKTSDVKAAKKGEGRLGVDAFYWSFVEFGTVKMSPRPFIRPALEDNVDRATEVMKKRLAARLKKAGAL
jgi:HK97 gp10 family phage protein